MPNKILNAIAFEFAVGVVQSCNFILGGKSFWWFD